MTARRLSARGWSPAAWFAALFLTAGSVLMSCAVKEPASVEGTWVITSSVTPGISAMLPEQAEMWLGQSFQYTPDNVILGQTQCGPAEWKETSLSGDDFLREYHVSFERLGIVANRVARFDVSCHGEHVPGQSILVAGKDKAFTLWDGVFFKMEKAGPDPQQFAG